MNDQWKNAIVGLFVLSATAIFVFTLFFLHPKIGNEDQTLLVRFSNVDKVTIGTRVTFAGRPVGEVTNILEIEGPRENTYQNGHVYVFEVVLKIDSNVEVYSSDEISLRTAGLLGEKMVAIIPKKPKKGQPSHKIVKGEVLYATETASIEETFEGFGEFSEIAESAVRSLIEQLDEIKKEKIWQQVGSITRNLSDITGALNDPRKWNETLDNCLIFSSSLRNLGERATIAFDHVERIVEHLSITAESIETIAKKGEQIADSLLTTTSHIQEITQKMKKGEGTAGKILVDNSLYLTLQAALTKAQTLMDDINHYGLLFQNDKGWQRVRARRRNLLHTLSTPQEFQNFFCDELNLIHTSLSRVSTLLKQTQEFCPPQLLLRDPDFRRLFADLLQRASELENDIKFYNIQLVDENLMSPSEIILQPCRSE